MPKIRQNVHTLCSQIRENSQKIVRNRAIRFVKIAENEFIPFSTEISENDKKIVKCRPKMKL